MTELTKLRNEIDALDEQVHHALMARAKVIDRLVEIKKADATGSAFRPLREAQMLEMLMARHSGTLPLSFMVGLWRSIMSTFTTLQAPFSVHLLGNSREMAREFYGFQVEFITENSSEAVVNALVLHEKNLGLLPVKNWSVTLPLGVQIIAWWKDAVILGSSKIDTEGLTHAVINDKGVLKTVSRETLEGQAILGYCTPFEGI
jgi:chorismate mutase